MGDREGWITWFPLKKVLLTSISNCPCLAFSSFFFSEIMSLFKTIINSFYILSFPPSVYLCGYTEMEMHLFIKT